jgi:hypothetical protein
MNKIKTEEQKRLTKLTLVEWRGSLPQCSKDPNSEIGIWRARRAAGISCAISNDDLDLARSKWDYNPATGIFVFKSGKNAGKIAGCKSKQLGYILLSLYANRQLAHRVAW